MKPTLSDDDIRRATAPLDSALAAFVNRFPGDSPARQPVHTVYGGAQLFKSDTPKKLGQLALRALQEHAPDGPTFASAIGVDRAQAETVYRRVIEKLRREPVEDFRIDFEDGYGNRPDDEEDGHAAAAARGRAVAAHFGTYDYTASCNSTAAHQRMDHPACDFARHMMQVAYAGTGLWLSDGATNVMPIGDRETVHRAWRLHVDHIRHSLVNA